MLKKVAKSIQWGRFDLMKFMGKNCPSGLVVGYKPDVSELSGMLLACRGGLGEIIVASSGFLTTVFVDRPYRIGNPPQDSCLGIPMDRGAWRATAHRVAKSWIQLSTHTHRVQMEFAPNLESPLCNEKDNWNLKSWLLSAEQEGGKEGCHLGWCIITLPDVCRPCWEKKGICVSTLASDSRVLGSRWIYRKVHLALRKGSLPVV